MTERDPGPVPPARAAGRSDPDEVRPAAVVELVESWLRSAPTSDRRRRRRDRQLAALLDDPGGLRFAMAFIDRVMRAPTPAAAAAQMRDLVARRGTPRFLAPPDRVLLRAGAALAPRAPRVVLPLAVRRIRALTGHLVLAAEDPALALHLEASVAAGNRTNLNRLGEAILGDEEAARRMERALALLGRDDVDYVSVKISAIASRLNLWAFEPTVERVAGELARLYRAAQAHEPAKFVNLDMEEYRDLDLTIEAFRRVLEREEFAGLDAGIVLQAYLPDSFARLRELAGWAAQRHRRAGGVVKVRVVKGANLAMERVEAEIAGWAPAPYTTKDEVDANWKRMVDWALRPEHLDGVRIGVASHNLFDVAWAHLLAERRGTGASAEFEMLEGMAPDQAAQVRAATGGMLLYTPIVGGDEYQSAIAYLFRRLEENAAPENFLRHLFELVPSSPAFAEQRSRFERSLAARWSVSEAPRRRQDRGAERPAAVAALGGPFVNEPDTDPALAPNRKWMADAVAAWRPGPLDAVVTERAEVDRAVATARRGAETWAATPVTERALVLERAAAEMAPARGHIVATMAHEAGKVVGEGDPEVSEAIDFARYYARAALALDEVDGASFEPLGVILVAPPWNFPFAIAAGGVLAALAAGNAVIVKPPPETPRCVALIVDCLRRAGLPEGVLTYLRTPDDEVGRHLVTHDGVDAVILTGAWETAQLFRSWKPDLALFGETSGKNAMIVTTRADVDGAVADLVASAFGHAGQKCSAASLAIVEAGMHDSEAFQRQLRDAVTSLVVGPATDLRSDIGPLIHPPSGPLARAFGELGPGERWLVEPEARSDDGRLWRPGVKLGVRPGDWFHHTECFGPVLGVMRAESLAQALEWQNAVAYGLTGGLWSLDPDQVEWWLERVEVGNAYVNRRTTGAIVRRQPFGGWKRSVVGPGAKAGGPNYVAQFGTWRDASLPLHGARPGPEVRQVLARFEAWAARSVPGEPDADPAADAASAAWLSAAVQSDAWWWAREFSQRHDPSGLVAERNEFRYRPLGRVVIRVAAELSPARLARLVTAAALCRVVVHVSVDPACSGARSTAELASALGVAAVLEREDTLAARLASLGAERVRAIGTVGPALLAAASGQACHVERSEPLACGRVELVRWLREQSISRTMHRYGNLVGADEG